MTKTEVPTDVAPVRPGEELDWARLRDHLLAELPELSGSSPCSSSHVVRPT
ncbi:hypothetical protein [Nocardioides alcanivorans]|uniref:hypothetical protein n=1 Tax=Nocardioides alcanivorans TaxID=2897352 RepID=UPI001F41840F|nr:hypothetical protein [Nocardioides alcanivorans]